MARDPRDRFSEKVYLKNSSILKDQNFSLENRKIQKNIKGSDVGSSLDPENILPHSSFNQSYTAYYSTSQLSGSVDFSKFENHTFFDSAESKVNYSFDKIINQFPFDGSKEVYNNYIESLDGFTSYVLNLFPKNTGYLTFNGTNKLEVQDKSGYLFPSISKNKSGESVIDPQKNNFSFDFRIYIPKGITKSGNNTQQIIFQKLNGYSGFTCFIDQINNDNFNLNFLVSNGSLSDINKFGAVEYNFSYSECLLDTFHHVCINVTNILGKRNITIYIDGINKTKNKLTSPLTLNSEKFSFSRSDLVIASGSSHIVSSMTGSHKLNNLILTGSINSILQSGSLDEFRIFHASRDLDTIIKEKEENIFSSDSLKLYFKFNEPNGEYTNNSVVLDSSGNSLHSKIISSSNSNETLSESSINFLRTQYSNVNSSLKFENNKLSPVLFPNNTNVLTLNSSLLEKASEYDSNNPNLIFKLFPKHYFLESSEFENFDYPHGNLYKSYDQFISMTGGIKKPKTHSLANILLVWARYFDSIKLFIDVFSKINTVTYDDINNSETPDNFINLLTETFGFDFSEFIKLPTNNNKSNMNILHDNTLINESIRSVQNKLWKRILINSQDILRSKGTLHGINAIFRASGIDPNKFYHLNEFGGNNKNLDSFISTKKVKRYIDFSLNIKDKADSNSNSNAFNKLYFSTSPLVNRNGGTSPGYPIVSQHSGSLNNSALTGSWTIESTYKFNTHNLYNYSLEQSLLRVNTKNSSGIVHPIYNLIFKRDINTSVSGTLYLVGYPYTTTLAHNNAKIFLSSSNIPLLDGNNWYVSVGKNKHFKSSKNTSTYNIFIKRSGLLTEEDKIYKNDLLVDTINVSSSSIEDLQNTKNINYSIEEPTLNIGYYKYHDIITGSSGRTLGVVSSSYSSQYNINTVGSNFEGKVTELRVWSKYLSESERTSHSFDFENFGVDNPNVNYSFESNLTGSDEQLCFHLPFHKNENTISNNILKIDDYSQNKYLINSVEHNCSGTLSFLTSSYNPINQIKFDHIISKIKNISYGDSGNSNKVRILSLQNSDFINNDSVFKAPLYEIPSNLDFNDDSRFSIESSVIKFLNSDIEKLFSSIQYFDNIVGDESYSYSSSYEKLRDMRNIYFNRLTDEINFEYLLKVFMMLDNLLYDILLDAIPNKSRFLGSYYVIESHLLERHKYDYKFMESSIPIITNESGKGTTPRNKENLNYIDHGSHESLLRSERQIKFTN